MGPSSAECRYAGIRSWFDWMGSQWPSMGVRSRPRVISVEQVVFGRPCKDPNWVLSGIAYLNYLRIWCLEASSPSPAIRRELGAGHNEYPDVSFTGVGTMRLGYLFALTLSGSGTKVPAPFAPRGRA